MIELDGIEYDVKSPSENAAAMVTYINDYCTNNSVTNSKGETVQIAENMANPLYLILYGLGYLISVVQKLIYNAGCTFSIPASSESQLMNLANIAGVKRHDATATTIQAIIFADAETACEITTSLQASVIVGTTTVIFSPAYDTIIEAGGVITMPLIADQEGSFSISANTITSFDSPVTGLRSIKTLASIPGTSQETIAALRNRIQSRSINGTQTDLVAADIQALPGVSRCNVYFNISAIDSEVIGDATTGVPGDSITVNPRQALILVQGFSNNIAETFYRRMFCLTSGQAEYNAIIAAQQAGTETNRTIVSQTYTTLSGQALTIYIASPRILPLYVRVYVGESLGASDISNIKDTVATLSAVMMIGKEISSVDVTKLIQGVYKTLTLQGVYLSVDGENYSYKATPAEDVLYSLNINNIEVLTA